MHGLRLRHLRIIVLLEQLLCGLLPKLWQHRLLGLLHRDLLGFLGRHGLHLVPLRELLGFCLHAVSSRYLLGSRRAQLLELCGWKFLCLVGLGCVP